MEMVGSMGKGINFVKVYRESVTRESMAKTHWHASSIRETPFPNHNRCAVSLVLSVVRTSSGPTWLVEAPLAERTDQHKPPVVVATQYPGCCRSSFDSRRKRFECSKAGYRQAVEVGYCCCCSREFVVSLAVVARCRQRTAPAHVQVEPRQCHGRERSPSCVFFLQTDIFADC